jgi:hypothetical protein
MNTYTITINKFQKTIDETNGVTDLSTYVNACIELRHLQDSFDTIDSIHSNLVNEARLADEDFEDIDDILLEKAKVLADDNFKELHTIYASDGADSIESVLNKFSNDGCKFSVELELELDA